MSADAVRRRSRTRDAIGQAFLVGALIGGVVVATAFTILGPSPADEVTEAAVLVEEADARIAECGASLARSMDTSLRCLDQLAECVLGYAPTADPWTDPRWPPSADPLPLVAWCGDEGMLEVGGRP